MKRYITLIALCALTTAALAGELLSGSGAPGAGLGANGDHYFRTDTSQLYKKASGAWSPIAARLAVKGDKGDTGSTGQRGLAGPAGPAGPGLRTFPNAITLNAAAPQYVGQLALRTDNNALFRGSGFAAGNWTLIPTQGPPGENGATLRFFASTAAMVAQPPTNTDGLAVFTDQLGDSHLAVKSGNQWITNVRTNFANEATTADTSFTLRLDQTPDSETAPATDGNIAVTTDYLYVHNGDVWRKIALTDF